jgi:hypothetical protein
MAGAEGGYSAYFVTAHDLVHDLGRATEDSTNPPENRLDRRLRVYLGPKLLIMDLLLQLTRWATCPWTTWAPRSCSSS